MATTMTGVSDVAAGPFEDSDGNLYVVEADETNDLIHVWKSASGGASWSEQDTADEPSITGAVLAGRHVVAAHAVTSGTDTVIHIATLSYTTPAMGDLNFYLEYHTFNCGDHATTPDNWVITDEAAHTFTRSTASGAFVAGITLRSDGDVLVGYSGAMAADMGADYTHFHYARRESASWTTGVRVHNDATGGVHFYGRAVLLGNSDRTHFLWTTSATADLFGRTVDSSNSLAPTAGDVTIETTTNAWLSTSSALVGIAVGYNDGGTWRGLAAANGTTATEYYVQKLAESGSPTAVAADGSAFDILDASVTNQTNWRTHPAVDTAGDAYYVPISNATDDDLYYDTFATTATAGGTDTLLWTGTIATTGDPIHRAAYGPVSNVIGFVFEDNSGNWLYDELSLGAVTKELVGTSAATSSATGVLKVTHELAGLSAAVSATSGVLSSQVTKTLVGSSAAVSATTGDLKVTKKLVGVSAAVSSTSGDLKVTKKLAGQADATSAVSGVLELTHELSGQVDATSATSGVLSSKATKSLTGTAAASSATSGVLKLTHKLAGTTAATSAITGDLKLTHPLAGQADAVSSVSGSLDVARKLAGQTDATSNVTGVLSVTTPGAAELTGSVTAVSAVTGTLELTHELTGAAAATSNVTGDLKLTHELAGTSASVTATTGTLDVTHQLAGQSDTVSSVTGLLEVTHLLAGSVASSSTVTGALELVHELAGTAATVSSLSGVLTVPTLQSKGTVTVSDAAAFGCAVTDQAAYGIGVTEVLVGSLTLTEV